MEDAQIFIYFFYYVFKIKNKRKIYFASLLKIYEQMEDER